MLLSIVSGTYNRLPFLKTMVESVRYSLGKGIPYEIVLVDGGSTDGSLEWMKAQPDIRLIEHGKLLGCIKAFNDGCAAAKGDYVVLANDDIYFVDESLLLAIRYMQDNPTVGVGCFYQDRGGRDWYVDTMPAVIDGKQRSWWYGQVCIVPRWLGDKLGWWGDYWAYGGDNELSCNVLEFGYKVEPIPCARIHDPTPMDELRKINNPPGPSKDAIKWTQKWTHADGTVGPIINPTIPNDNPVVRRELRILYAPIYEKGWLLQKVTKRGLRDALSRIGLVTEYDYLGEGIDRMFDVACAFEPDIIITQIQDERMFPWQRMKELRQEHPKTTFVNWNGDYHPEQLFDPKYILLAKLFDAFGVVTTAVEEKYNNAGIKWFYWQIGYEEASDYPRKVNRHDVLFQANGYSEERLSLARMLTKYPANVGIYGSWPSWVKAKPSTLYNFDLGAALIKSSKIVIGDSQWPDAEGFVSNRMFQTMAAGGFMLHQWFDGIERLLRMTNGKHLVVWEDFDELKELLDYWLDPKNDAERKRIAQEGQQFVLHNHSFDVRVKELCERIGL